MVRKLLPYILIAVVLLIAACDATPQTPPPITVVITAVDDTAALADGVAQALTGTAQVHIAATETELAYQGIRPTDTPTLTPSLTFTAAPTRQVTHTPTPTPTITLTPTYAPYPTNTPGAVAQQDSGISWIRILNASRQFSETGLDIYINDTRVSRNLLFKQDTTYQQVPTGSVRVSLQGVDVGYGLQPGQSAPPPLLSTVLSVPDGAALSVLILDTKERELQLFPVQENIAPLASGESRLTLVQANPFLLVSNILIPTNQRALGYTIEPEQVIGPMDVPPGIYPLELYDSTLPDQIYARLDQVDLANRVSYLLVFISPDLESNVPTDYILFTSTNRRIETDLGVRFVNSYASPITISLDNQVIFQGLPVGEISPVIPVSRRGSNAIIQNLNGQQLYAGLLGPWQGADADTDKIIVASPNENAAASDLLGLAPFSQNPPTTAIRSSLRLIHALPGTIGLSLQVRPAITVNPGDTPPDWVTIAGAEALQSSNYVGRTPGVYNVRVVLQGATSTNLGQISNVELLAGGLYDFIVVPGDEVGITRLVLVEPEVQFTSAGISEGDPKVVAEAVGATLTALAPDVTATPTLFFTTTPTITPVPTNTPRPTNTPDVLPPSVIVVPAPPDSIVDTLSLIGQNFSPDKNYTVTLDNSTTPLVRGRTSEEGLFSETITLPTGTAPGWYTLVVCVDCRAGGVNQQVAATILVAPADLTPTVTPAP